MITINSRAPNTTYSALLITQNGFKKWCQASEKLKPKRISINKMFNVDSNKITKSTPINFISLPHLLESTYIIDQKTFFHNRLDQPKLSIHIIFYENKII